MTDRRKALGLGLAASALALSGRGKAKAADALLINSGRGQDRQTRTRWPHENRWRQHPGVWSRHQRQTRGCPENRLRNI